LWLEHYQEHLQADLASPHHQWPAKGHQKPPANPEALSLEYPSSFISIKDPLFGH
jgi:hypothetical protein